MSSPPSHRFRANWLAWTVERPDRTFRVYVVEPRNYAPRKHASIFRAALDPFLTSPEPEYLLDDERSRTAQPIASRHFDLLTFPEAFLPSDALLDFLRSVGDSPPTFGCVHTGLRPPGLASPAQSHLFKPSDLRELLTELADIANLWREDLTHFDLWLGEQQPGDRFNLGCLFTVDSDRRIRLCLHPKLVRSRFEESPSHDAHMTEANLLSLVTLIPADTSLSRLTIQPLICSDALWLPTDSTNNQPIEAVNQHRTCFVSPYSDQVDVVSLATLTPNTMSRLDGHPRLHWHQQFRKAFERATTDDGCRRHKQAVFVLSNYRQFSQDRLGGLSGVYIPLSTSETQYRGPLVARTMALYGYFRENSVDSPVMDPDRWIDVDELGHEREKTAVRGHIVALNPDACRDLADATMFGLTIHRLPSDADLSQSSDRALALVVEDTSSSQSARARLQFAPWGA
ncbi:MAG: hypothetical protein ACHREM_20860 [Polyangiales bacterium]